MTVRQSNLRTLEAFSRVVLSTVVEYNAQSNGNIKVDANDVSFDGGAKASGNFKISQTLNEAAAREGWWGANNCIHQTQQVGTYTQLKGINGTFGVGMTGRRCLWDRW
ncbi:hypothetical protein L6164_036044 [Bauhinia variegata]|uniref:Uncharacterized protein n=1 Tax=Bauhinia variegata TaxID=167791 RepID=A0ACB9KFS8_BAUVA|nr:hypothetical protein L6164_036044 [Bauhinia variegata]